MSPDRVTRFGGGRATVLTVVGTRPEAIKLAPVVRALEARGDEVGHRLVLTGQHTDLVEQVLPIFHLEPDRKLDLMKPGQTLYDIAHGCLDRLREVVRELAPELILVQGDTATVFFASLVGFFERVAVGHVEAGLRSRHKWSPYPEEMLRRLTDTVSDLHFAPTAAAAENLFGEGYSTGSVHVTGNTVVDALQAVAGRKLPPGEPALARLAEAPGRWALVTAHRRESFGAPIRELFGALLELVDRHDDLRLFYPVHPNPQVRGPAEELLGRHPRIHLVPPIGYTDLVWALAHADLILTDSGGIQEEAPTFGTPVLVLREVTERPEGVEAGVAELVGTDRARIVERASVWLSAGRHADPPPNPYGDGRAGERIADIVVSHLTGTERTTADWEGPGA